MKKRYLFLLIIVCLFAISAVSAQEMDALTDDSDSVLITESVSDDSVLKDSSDEIIAVENTNDSLENEILSYKEINIDAQDVVKYYGGSERFIVRLSDGGGLGIENEVAIISINGNVYFKGTDYNGYASIALELNSGDYTVTTECNGKKVYSKVTIKDTVISKDFTKMFQNSTQYSATLVDSDGKTLPYNTPVKININGVYYTRYTDSNGVVVMNINLNPGTYDLTATNPSTGEMHTTKVTVRPTIVENYDLTKYYRNASQYSLRLLDDKGNPVGAGVNVKLNINGVFYTRTSDANGYVRMNINLNPGEYVITSEYNGLRASNRIYVKSTIDANDLSMKFRDGSAFKVRLLTDTGVPYANQQVTFNINGVFYTKVTDNEGYATLNINLQAGDYVITSSYNGLNAANNIKVAPDYLYYTIGNNPLDYDYYVDDANRFSFDWHYIAQSDSYLKTIYDIYGNQGMEARDVSYGVKYMCYEASTGKEIFLNEAGEIISWSYGRGYTETYIIYDKDNNILERGRWIDY